MARLFAGRVGTTTQGAGMRCLLAVIAYLLLHASPAFAADKLVGADATAIGGQCPRLVQAVVASTGARFDHLGFDGQVAALLHRDFERLDVVCSGERRWWSVGGNVQVGFPQPGFYHTLATAGSTLTGEPAVQVEQGLRRCYRQALDDDEETSMADIGAAHIECLALLRLDDGVTMLIFKRPG